MDCTTDEMLYQTLSCFLFTIEMGTSSLCFPRTVVIVSSPVSVPEQHDGYHGNGYETCNDDDCKRHCDTCYHRCNICGGRQHAATLQSGSRTGDWIGSMTGDWIGPMTGDWIGLRNSN